jgi:uncharacterized membrane protein HdeD (DUF308 family)
MIFLLLRRLGPRARLITGVVLVVAGLVVVAVSVAVAAGLLIHGVALAVIGAAMCVPRRVARRRRESPRPGPAGTIITVAKGSDR